MANMLGALVRSRKAWVLLLAIIGVVVMNIAGRISGEEALGFIKWMVVAWFGAVATEDAAKKIAGEPANKDEEKNP